MSNHTKAVNVRASNIRKGDWVCRQHVNGETIEGFEAATNVIAFNPASGLVRVSGEGNGWDAPYVVLAKAAKVMVERIYA